MHDAVRVGGSERLRDLRRDVDGFVHGNALARDAGVQRLPFDVLEHDRNLAVRFKDVVHGGDVGMIERRRSTCLAHQPLARRQILDAGRPNHLERDPALQPRVFGQPHFAHAAAAKVAQDPIRAD